jgi:hypothetical protein
MTAHRDLKRIIRARQQKTGESYTAARAHILRERDALLGKAAGDPMNAKPMRADAAVLKVNQQSVRVRILGEDGQVTFRTRDVAMVVPGHIVTLVIEKRWTWRGEAYASGRIQSPRIDVEKLGLIPLPLEGGELEDLRSIGEPYRSPDPYAPLWRKLTARPRPCFQMDRIAWGTRPEIDVYDYTACDASELAASGDLDGAEALLMEVLCADLRRIDAHVLLGNLVFDRWPERALEHYEVGVRIAELSIPRGFDGVLRWSVMYNRPYLRCLHGYGQCLWRLGRPADALQVFERILSLNPNDNQGVRFCRDDILHGRSWETVVAREVAKAEQRGIILQRPTPSAGRARPPGPAS